MSTTEEDIQTHINMVSAKLPVPDMKSKQITDETAQDTELQHVMESMSNGWFVGSCPLFYHIRGELSVVNGLLLKQDKIVISQTMRQEMLTRLHEGHLGIEKCKRRARETVFWPGMNREIKNMIRRCETCQK